MSQVVESLFCKEEDLYPNPNTTKKKEAEIRGNMIQSQLVK
jgi:hypothetical protein